jgi:hypothetical protein
VAEVEGGVAVTYSSNIERERMRRLKRRQQMLIVATRPVEGMRGREKGGRGKEGRGKEGRGKEGRKGEGKVGVREG